ncbi:MAG: PQQ-binding-like beta-propeller repeat protein [Kiritimatiellia bacterium]|jgi:outer membrane protein assembly factor BamB|nr:PQQ-binding-like beta-propeller repeat protein [Kiritimatiellia bacterium]
MNRSKSLIVSLVAVFCMLALIGQTADSAALLKASGVKGGLIVQIGVDDPASLAGIAEAGPYLVHGLDTDAKKVEAARSALLKLGLYGKVTVAKFNGKALPYVDNFVNLVVTSDKGEVTSGEIERVLVPGGKLVEKGSIKSTKPTPPDTDEWNHFLHSPDNNAVAQDSKVGMPRSMQWVCEPRWGRSHEEFASMSAAVTANGRYFYIVDEAPNVSIRFMPNWKLVARDAFNGVLLWKRGISQWNDHLRHFRSGPAHLPRRLVAIGDRVYATLGLAAPVIEIDAASGDVLKTYKGTEHTEEILVEGGVMYLSVGTSEKKRQGGGLAARGEPEPTDFRYVTAVDVKSAKELWRKDYSGERVLLPLGTAVKNGRVYCQTLFGLHCLDAGSGKELWETRRESPSKRMGYAAPTLVVTDEVVLSADRLPGKEPQGKELEWGVHGWNAGGFARKGASSLCAYAVEDGKQLWSAPCSEKYNSQVDLFVIRGLVWFSPGYQGRDLKTGEVKETINIKGDRVGMAHHRCYRNKASENFIFLGRSGIELLSLDKGWIGNNSWVRGTCQYGIMPSYGMLYAPPDACGCFLTVKAPGFIAVAPKRKSPGATPEDRLEKGPAYGKPAGSRSPEAGSDWPMYRRDTARSGVTPSKVSDTVKESWSTKIGGAGSKLTQPVIADGRVYVASVDTHTVHALDATNGKELWSYTAGCRVDSSPSIYKGMVFFGCTDGWVYSLDAATGKLAWRFLAAPGESLVSAYGQLESLWPVHGAVLIQNDVLYATAGRSSYMDGGFTLYAIDPVTGKELAKSTLYHHDPETDKQIPREGGFNMEGTTSEVLSGDGNLVYLKHFAFDKSVKRTTEGIKPHLFAITGLLGEEWFVRSYWTLSTSVNGAGWGGWASTHNKNPSGRIICFDDSNVYGYGRQWAAGAATGHKAETYGVFNVRRAGGSPKPPAGEKGKRRKSSGKGGKPRAGTVWFSQESIIARAMVVADDKIVVAGPPNLAKKAEGFMAFANEDEAVAGYMGKRGSYLCILSKEDGKQISETTMDAMPVIDGMSMAGGQLFISLKNGELVCYGGN